MSERQVDTVCRYDRQQQPTANTQIVIVVATHTACIGVFKSCDTVEMHEIGCTTLNHQQKVID
jgi:hypothetical protein